MPYLDVTNPAISGLNAASGAVEGVVRGHALGAQMEQQRQSRIDDAEYKRQLLSARNRELAALARERERDNRFRDQEAKLRNDREERRLKISEGYGEGVEEVSEYVANMTEKTLGATTVDDLEEQLRAQRANVIRFTAGLGPRARAIALAADDDDAKAERAALAQRAAKAGWEKVLSHPLLSQDASPMGEELRALAMENIEALETGAETPAQSMRDLEEIRSRVDEHRTQQRNWQSGLMWAEQQMGDGVGNTEAMNRVVTMFENEGPGADLKRFKRDFLKAKYDVEMETVKLGKIEIPRSIKVGTPEWREIAESAADEEVVDLMDKDPLIKYKMDKGDFEGEDGERDYMDWRERLRKSTMRKYAALSGASNLQIQQMGLGEDPKKVEKNARSELEKRLRAAGIDPNQKIRPPSQSSRMDVQRREPGGMTLKPTGEPEVRGPVQPGRQRISSQGVNDGDAFDESDLEEIYGDSEE